MTIADSLYFPFAQGFAWLCYYATSNQIGIFQNRFLSTFVAEGSVSFSKVCPSKFEAAHAFAEIGTGVPFGANSARASILIDLKIEEHDR